MKKYIAILVFFTTMVNAQLKTPSLSPASKITQTIGLTEVEVEYSRPSVKGRVIFGETGLLPNNNFWRTGANTATKISFSKTVMVGGNELEKGVYTILTVPNEKKWEIRWYKYDSTNWNTYTEKSPLFMIEVPVIKNTELIETLEIHFKSITMSSADLLIEWEYKKVVIPIEVDESKEILKSIERQLNGPSDFDYFKAALYLHEAQRDLTKALQYIQKVTKSDKALFFQVTREALILRDLNRFKEAKNVAKRGLKLSKKAKNNDFIQLNKKIIEEL
jgi:tetratricopeptide (TPR) repeat protein